MAVDRERVVAALKKCYDPEIPIDIWNLGLIYRLEVLPDDTVEVDLTLTSPMCPVGPAILAQVRSRILEDVPEVKEAKVNLVFKPPWEPKLASDEGKMQLELMGVPVR